MWLCINHKSPYFSFAFLCSISLICVIFLYFDFKGLKKFLAQYPAIFIIDGDHVLVNSFEKSSSNDMFGGGTRDYIQESKDYFKHKLLQYGIGTEVPIKSLLGHRSQASPQIRHISGKIQQTKFIFSLLFRFDCIKLWDWKCFAFLVFF